MTGLNLQQQVSRMSEEQIKDCIELLEEDLCDELTDPADHESIHAGLSLLRLAAAELAAEAEAYRINEAGLVVG